MIKDDHMYEEYFEQYRKKVQDLEFIDSQIQNIRDRATQAIYDFSRKREKTRNEINDMRRVMTQMIDNGCDPVEARLKIDHNTQLNIWDTLRSDGFLTDQDISMSGSILGDFTASGAVGASYSMSATGPLGSVGPAGPAYEDKSYSFTNIKKYNGE